MWSPEPSDHNNDPWPWRFALVLFAFFVGAEYFFGGGIPLLILGGFISAIVGVVIADHLKDAPDEEGVEGNNHQQAAASQDDTQ